MVTIDRINSDYSVFYSTAESKWLGMCNKCGGTDAAANATLDTVMQAVITLLEAGVGGSIYLKEGQVGTLTYNATVLIIEDYHGVRKFYSNNAQIGEIGSGNYQTTSDGIESFTPTGSAFNGRVVTVYSSHDVDGGIALFSYANSAWHFVKLF